LRTLSELLYKHYNQKVYILIDEYDTPLNEAYLSGYIDNLTALMRNIMSSALKDNLALKKGIMTGVLRVSKDSMLSGLNNLKVYTTLDRKYSEFFGFTDTDLDFLFHEQNLDTCKDTIKKWYNGYNFAGITIYNPWSILSCLSENGEFSTEWVNTGNNAIVTKLLYKYKDKVQQQVVKLMEQGEITTQIDKHVALDTMLNNVSSFWSLLLFSGYLTIVDINHNVTQGVYDCKLKVPNAEILTLFNRYYAEWFSEQLGKQYELFLNSLVNGDVNIFLEQLQHYWTKSVSVWNERNSAENFYHGLVLGLIASLRNTHSVISTDIKDNYHILILPLPKTILDLGIIINFKHTIESNDNLEELAQEELTHINLKDYAKELKKLNLTKILKISLAVNQKQMKPRWQWEKTI